MKSTLNHVLILFLVAVGVCQINADTFVSDGIVYRNVAEISSKLGMSLASANDGKEITLKSKWSTIRFTQGSRIAEINGTKVYFGYPVILHNKSLFIPELDWQFTIRPILIPPRITAKQRNIRTIIIDPGHGGDDPGAQNLKVKLNEKDLTLSVAKYLEKRLKKHGFKVILTRKNDTTLKLADRPTLARKRKADLFVSLHFNSSTNESAHGIESFAYTLLNQPSTSRKTADAGDKIFRRANRNDNLNVLLAYYLQTNLISQTGEIDRGVKRARFTVLEELQCPGVLVELGFVRNPETSKKIKTNRYLESLAEGIEKGILQFKTRLESK